MAAWRVARSLDTLLGQLNAIAPRRNKAADGAIGDVAHQAQGSASDHNPWYGPGVVTARDFTHDPAGGLDCDKLAAALAQARDPRLKYMIWQGRIMDSRAQFRPWTWQPSSGHYHHLHLSVMPNASADDTRPWTLPGLIAPPEDDVLTEQDLIKFFYHFPIRGKLNVSQLLHAIDDNAGAANARTVVLEKRFDALVTALGGGRVPTAQEIAAELLPAVEDIAERVAQADNVQQAAEVVRQLGRVLDGAGKEG
jgi:hypothetical protein